MTKPARYVYVEGEIYRLSERQYVKYLTANVSGDAPVANYGKYVGRGINVNQFRSSEFMEELINVERPVLAVQCPTCDSAVGERCQRTGERYEHTYMRGNGASTRDFVRKVPHESRVLAAAARSEK